jgi:DNA mismatch repair protein MutL
VAGRIHKLSENMIRKIAAGEVIERPASVVKELVENSLDASADRVHIEISDGGRQGIRVSDDGHGMASVDVDVCTERHATSKMRSPTDLFTIETLGFRGEALASIGAVARMSIDTRMAETDEGTQLVIEGGVRRSFGAIARDVGTTIEVRNLFFNTPARRKFLRHVETEARYVTQGIVSLAAAHPDVSFQLTHQDRAGLQLLPADRRQRAADLLNLPADELLWVEGEISGVRVEGLISPPNLCRRTRSKQFVVVRQRPVTSPPVQRAVYTGYGGLLPQRQHPMYVLWVDLDPRQLDVNVHPTKREVRFADDRVVREAVETVIRQTLQMPETTTYTQQPPRRSDWRSGSGTPVAPPVANRAPSEDRDTGPDSADTELASQRPAGAERRADSVGATGADAVADATETPAWTPSSHSPALFDDTDDAEQISLDLVSGGELRGEALSGPAGEEVLASARKSDKWWQFHDKYILLLVADGLLVIDQHAAHERVRFEEVLDILGQDPVVSQSLLMPLTVNVNPVEMAVYRQASDLFGRLGFDVREFGPATLLVEGLPPELRTWSEGDLFYELLSDLIEELDIRSEAREALAATMACHSSIRAGRRLAGAEIETLVQRLLRARNPFACPHGRPIIVRLPLTEFDRLFGR